MDSPWRFLFIINCKVNNQKHSTSYININREERENTETANKGRLLIGRDYINLTY